jgi:hypothetical protein
MTVKSALAGRRARKFKLKQENDRVVAAKAKAVAKAEKQDLTYHFGTFNGVVKQVGLCRVWVYVVCVCVMVLLSYVVVLVCLCRVLVCLCRVLVCLCRVLVCLCRVWLCWCASSAGRYDV